MGLSWSKVDPEENEESKEGGLMKGCQTSERVTVNRLARSNLAYKRNYQREGCEGGAELGRRIVLN